MTSGRLVWARGVCTAVICLLPTMTTTYALPVAMNKSVIGSVWAARRRLGAVYHCGGARAEAPPEASHCHRRRPSSCPPCPASQLRPEIKLRVPKSFNAITKAKKNEQDKQVISGLHAGGVDYTLCLTDAHVCPSPVQVHSIRRPVWDLNIEMSLTFIYSSLLDV